ncbi:hypothetical protein DH2020_011137 [Rehmannia glutinosa]|uniref:Uncharacterized protein n=1 Tax=Rehmannia glutinosa TaxID=99300 RepID=A0ABR0XCI4_REHGL
MERQRTPPQISSSFNASLPRLVPNWAINGLSCMLDTHAGEDSFELYKHTLLGPDQFALIPFEFTRLEELIAHNNFTNNALLHHLSLRAANWKRTLDAHEVEVNRLSKALSEAAGREQLAKENTSLVTRVQGLEKDVTAAHQELNDQKESRENELKETYDGVAKKATRISRPRRIYLFEGFERCRDQAIQEDAFKPDFNLKKLDCFRTDDLERANEGKAGEEEGLDVTRDVDEVEETDEWTDLMHIHIASTEPPPPHLLMRMMKMKMIDPYFKVPSFVNELDALSDLVGRSYLKLT